MCCYNNPFVIKLIGIFYILFDKWKPIPENPRTSNIKSVVYSKSCIDMCNIFGVFWYHKAAKMNGNSYIVKTDLLRTDN